MNNEMAIAPNVGVARRASVVNALASKLECDPQKLVPMLKKTAFATCKTDEEFMAMCMVANTYGLNPILKEVYAFPSKGGQVVPIVSVDGWIKLMNSHPAFDGIEFEEDNDSCTAIVYRKDRNHAIKATEWLGECLGNTEPWKRWPRRMLRHKALIQAARIAFGFAGIYDEDEGRRIAEAEGSASPSQTEETAQDPANAATLDKLRSSLGLKTGAQLAAEAKSAATKKKANADESESASKSDSASNAESAVDSEIAAIL